MLLAALPQPSPPMLRPPADRAFSPVATSSNG